MFNLVKFTVKISLYMTSSLNSCYPYDSITQSFPNIEFIRIKNAVHSPTQPGQKKLNLRRNPDPATSRGGSLTRGGRGGTPGGESREQQVRTGRSQVEAESGNVDEILWEFGYSKPHFRNTDLGYHIDFFYFFFVSS